MTQLNVFSYLFISLMNPPPRPADCLVMTVARWLLGSKGVWQRVTEEAAPLQTPDRQATVAPSQIYDCR